MATVQELLNRYNKIAARPLKSWKESREKLEKRLDRSMSIPRVEPVKRPKKAAPVGKEETRKTQPMNDHIREILVKNPGGWRKDTSHRRASSLPMSSLNLPRSPRGHFVRIMGSTRKSHAPRCVKRVFRHLMT